MLSTSPLGLLLQIAYTIDKKAYFVSIWAEVRQAVKAIARRQTDLTILIEASSKGSLIKMIHYVIMWPSRVFRRPVQIWNKSINKHV